jgi:hypothetical protein
VLRKKLSNGQEERGKETWVSPWQGDDAGEDDWIRNPGSPLPRKIAGEEEA